MRASCSNRGSPIRASIRTCGLLLFMALAPMAAQVRADGKHCPTQNPMSGRTEFEIITIPDKSLWSNLDGFSAFAEQSILPVREEIMRLMRLGEFDHPIPAPQWPIWLVGDTSRASGRIHVRPDPVQPRLSFRTLQYNPFQSLDELADQLCAWTEEPQQRHLLLLSQGFGAKIVAHALDRCIRKRIHHVYLNADETNGYTPPTSAYYSFGKNDLYRIQEQAAGAPLQSILEQVFYPDPMVTLSPYRAVQWNLTPEAAGLWWSGDERLRTVKPLHYTSSEGAIFPGEGQRFRFTLLVFLAGLTINQEFFDHWSQIQVATTNNEGLPTIATLTCPFRAFVFDGLWFYRVGAPPLWVEADMWSTINSQLPTAPLPLPPALERYFQQTYVREGFGNYAPDTSPSSCGNGKIDRGEECDPPSPNQCDGSCKRISKCGNHQMDPGEQCEVGDQVACLCRYNGLHMQRCQANCKIPSCDHVEPEASLAAPAPPAPAAPL